MTKPYTAERIWAMNSWMFDGIVKHAIWNLNGYHWLIVVTFYTSGVGIYQVWYGLGMETTHKNTTHHEPSDGDDVNDEAEVVWDAKGDAEGANQHEEDGPRTENCADHHHHLRMQLIANCVQLPLKHWKGCIVHENENDILISNNLHFTVSDI